MTRRLLALVAIVELVLLLIVGANAASQNARVSALTRSEWSQDAARWSLLAAHLRDAASADDTTVPVALAAASALAKVERNAPSPNDDLGQTVAGISNNVALHLGVAVPGASGTDLALKAYLVEMANVYDTAARVGQLRADNAPIPDSVRLALFRALNRSASVRP